MRRSWNEIRVQAAKFAAEWKDAKYEKGETQSFYNDFFRCVWCKASPSRQFRGASKTAGIERYILQSDFQTFELHDLDEDTEPVRFRLADLPHNLVTEHQESLLARWRELHERTDAFPPRLAQALDGATEDQLAEVEVLGSGMGLHWETLDVDLSVPDLLAGLFDD